jgi:hypothetical protein
MESSSTITATAKQWRAGTIAMDLSRRLLKAKYVKMHQQNRYSLRRLRKHKSSQIKAKLMNSRLAISVMIKHPNQHTIVVHETILRHADHLQHTQRLNLHNGAEMIGVIRMILDQINGISRN